MKVFVLEDDINRIMLMFEVFSKSPFIQLQICTSVKEAKAKFTPPYDLILLDHDLADEHYGGDVDKTEGTGQEFVKWMVDNYYPSSLDNPTVIVHSMNFDGAKRMLDLLRQNEYDAYHIPFGMNVLQLLGQVPQVAGNALTSEPVGGKIDTSKPTT